MKRGYRMVRDSVRHCPLPLIGIKGHNYVNSLLPYSTGIEISIYTDFLRDVYKNDNIIFIKPKIIQDFNLLDFDFISTELQFRIKPGVEGMVSLYNMCEFLKKYAAINPSDKAGNHYHIDCSEMKSFRYFRESTLSMNTDWILESLLSWNYKGSYNPYNVTQEKRGVVSFRSDYRTIEFRLGETTFDYSLMIKRIIHAQNIVKRMKSDYKRQFSLTSL